MGQKVRPTGFRVGITEPWRSRWYASKQDFRRLLIEDCKIRSFVTTQYKIAGVPKVEIERRGEEVKVIIHTARPGIIIGRKGAKVDQLKEDLEKVVGRKVELAIVEVNKPELDAQLVSESVAEQLEKRAAFRRVLKKTAEMSMQSGAKGIKLTVSGRLGGAEMSRTTTTRFGRIPLSTLQAHIDYGFSGAATPYGTIGVKCWIYLGEYPAPDLAIQDRAVPVSLSSPSPLVAQD